MLRKNYVMVVWIFCMAQTQAQDKLWETNLKEQLHKVGWIEQANDGLILAAGDKGLLALDNNIGEVVWHDKSLKAIDKNSLLHVPGLPMFYVEYVPVIGKKRGVLINSSNGDVLFDTKEDDYRIKGFNILPEREMILFELTKDKTRFLMKFDLRGWTKEWIVPVGEIKRNLLQNVLTQVSFIDQGPYFDNQDNMILGINDEVYVLNPISGTILWQYKTKKKIKTLVYSPLNNNLYLGEKKSNRLVVLDPVTGEDITPGKLKLRGYMIDLVEDDDTDNLILVESEGFNIIDPKTNSLQWKKSFKMEPLSEIIPKGSDFYAIGKGEKLGLMAKVDANGNKVWKSKINGYAYYNALMDKGIMYISTERSNIIDYETGKDVWDKDVKFRSIPAVTYDEQEDKVFIFENKKAYKFDLNTGEINHFADGVQLEKVSKKTPLQAEFVPNTGYFLFTDQHVSVLSQEGKLVYTDYYEPPSSTNALFELGNLAGRAFFGVDLDIEGALNNINMLNDLSNGVYQNSLDQNGAKSQTTVAAGLYVGNNDNMQKVFEVTTTRFFNSQQNKDHQFIVTKVKNADAPTKHAIYMIEKATGQIEKSIDLLDKTPNYFIDNVDGRAFINENNGLITAYQF